MAKKTQFQRSQMAHKRLMKRPQKKDVDWINRAYHSSVYQEQKKKKRVLMQREKKELFRLAEYYFYN